MAWEYPEIDALILKVRQLREMGGVAPSGAPAGMTTTANVPTYPKPFAGVLRAPDVTGMTRKKKKKLKK